MAKAEPEIELDDDDDFVVEEDDTVEIEVRDLKSNLTRRRQIDNLLEERRLQKQLNEFDFDL